MRILRAFAKRTSQMIKWTDVKISKCEMVLKTPYNRVNMPCLTHDTRLCKINVKMTNDHHGIYRM